MSKAAEAFRTISEVAGELNVQKHVLRFWESKFPQIRPMKRGGGRRYYRPEDMELLRGIRHLLHAEGYTIKGVQKILREHGIDHVKQFSRAARAAAAPEGRRKRARDADTAPADRSAAESSAREAVRAPGRAAQPRPSPGLAQRAGRLEAALKELAACRRLLLEAVEGSERSRGVRRARAQRA